MLVGGRCCYFSSWPLLFLTPEVMFTKLATNSALAGCKVEELRALIGRLSG